MSIEGYPVTKACLIYKIMVLENVRYRLEEELRVFTKKASEDVQRFLRTAKESSRMDGVQLLDALDVKCTVIERLTGLFRQLIADPEDRSLIANQPNNHLHGPVLKWGRNVMISNILKFGPMLHNVVLATSITNAVQTLGAALTIQQIQTVFTSLMSQAQVQIPNALQYNQTKDNQLSSDDCQDQSRPKTPVRHHSHNVTLGNPATRSTGQQFEKPLHGVTSCLQNEELGTDVTIQHQKQTSSQLIQFLQTKCRSDLLACFPGTVQPSVDSATHDDMSPLLIEGTLSEVKGKPVYDNLYQGTNGLLIATSAPVFEVKEDYIDGALRCTYIVSTKYELWDIGNIFIDENLISSRSPPQQVDVLGSTSGTCAETKEEITEASSVQRHITGGVGTLSPCPIGSNLAISKLVGPELQQLSLDTDLHCSRSFAEMDCIPDIGTYVLGWFPRQKMWCRGQVLKINGMREGASVNLGSAGGVHNINLEVRRIDYGDVACISLQHIKELDDLTAALPEQALQVALANVSPVNGQDWTPEAVCWLKDKVHNRTLFARLFPQETKVMVELFMEKGKIGGMRRSASLSTRLALCGHANHSMINLNLRKSLNSGRDKNVQREAA
ncbi:uncharacterized protein LOC125712638 isoform X2 [Brienomyrus brachyistius]|uniref:uncharacterized protein LOC125712638 isoform X2 n=1 Tax=Brienomyrus brachyistius TaxID=42636 RepID=UPI0020B213EC|nr:uncharacterized protein LOC125712638 isoform X2 [Brienomyrus brachyistius]